MLEALNDNERKFLNLEQYGAFFKTPSKETMITKYGTKSQDLKIDFDKMQKFLFSEEYLTTNKKHNQSNFGDFNNQITEKFYYGTEQKKEETAKANQGEFNKGHELLYRSSQLLQSLEPSNRRISVLPQSSERSKVKYNEDFETPERKYRQNKNYDSNHFVNDQEVDGNLEDTERRRYPSILHLLEGARPKRRRTKKRISRREYNSRQTTEESMDNLLNLAKSSISKKTPTPARRRRHKTSRSITKNTDEDLEYGAVDYVTGNPEYTPFFSTLMQNWPGSDKNLDLNKFTKGFTMEGDKIDPTQTYKMSPIKKSKYSPLGLTLGEAGKLLRKSTIEDKTRSSKETLSQTKRIKSSRGV